jgi:Glycosyltransferase family 17
MYISSLACWRWRPPPFGFKRESVPFDTAKGALQYTHCQWTIGQKLLLPLLLLQRLLPPANPMRSLTVRPKQRWTTWSTQQLAIPVLRLAFAFGTLALLWWTMWQETTSHTQFITERRIATTAIHDVVVELTSTTANMPFLNSAPPLPLNDDHRHIGPTAIREGIPNGILSRQPISYFRHLQGEIDALNRTERCARYGWTYTTTGTGSHQHSIHRQRRIFYGALVAGEPWEVWDIAATEAYGIYSGLVLVEANRTQNLTPRTLRQLHHGPLLAQLFGVPTHMVQVRTFVDESEVQGPQRTELQSLQREHRQRQEILRGWKELGMQGDDVGFLADADESLTRDFVRAVQTCDGIAQLDYATHRCQHQSVKILTTTRIFEASPECITQDRQGWHPELMIGHCLEEIGNASHHPYAHRETPNSVLRAVGFGNRCSDWEGEANITNGRYPLWSAADFRRTCGGSQLQLMSSPNGDTTAHINNEPPQIQRRPPPPFDMYTAFHVHNFFAHLDHVRFKYRTYGHANPDAHRKPIFELSDDLQLMYACVLNHSQYQNVTRDTSLPMFERVRGGFAQARPFLPLYFYDADYRKRRHAYVRDLVLADAPMHPPLH